MVIGVFPYKCRKHVKIVKIADFKVSVLLYEDLVLYHETSNWLKIPKVYVTYNNNYSIG